MMERIMIIRRMLGLILLFRSKFGSDRRVTGGGCGSDEGERKFWVFEISGKAHFIFSRENFMGLKEKESYLQRVKLCCWLQTWNLSQRERDKRLLCFFFFLV